MFFRVKFRKQKKNRDYYRSSQDTKIQREEREEILYIRTVEDNKKQFKQDSATKD